MSDSLALFYNKGVRFVYYWIMRGQRYSYPNGKENTLFSSWEREEVMISEHEFRQKVIPLYEMVKNDESKSRLCLSWYNKGLSEYEIVDRFLSFWVSLESITSSNVKRDVDA